jgi:inner membrane protein
MLLAAAAPLNRREKAIVVAAGLAPDLDGLGAIPELLTRNSSHPLLWFSKYHHTLHTLAFALVVTAAAWLCSSGSDRFVFGQGVQELTTPSRPRITALLAFLSFHLHLFCDLVGSRGPDGCSWPIPYFAPFSSRLQLVWHGQWVLNGWQNFVITGLVVAVTLWMAWKYGSSPIELVSDRGNRATVAFCGQGLPRKPAARPPTRSAAPVASPSPPFLQRRFVLELNESRKYGSSSTRSSQASGNLRPAAVF